MTNDTMRELTRALAWDGSVAEKGKFQAMVLMDLEQLSSDLGYQLDNNQLIDFILELDAQKSDLHFTQVLIMKLRQSIEEENVPMSEQVFELVEAMRRTSALIEDSEALLNGVVMGDNNGVHTGDSDGVPEASS